MTINTSSVIATDSEVPMFEVALTRQYGIPYKKGNTVAEAASVLHSILDSSPVEKMVCLYMDLDNSIVGSEIVGIGDQFKVETSFQNLFRGAILSGVKNIIIGHNHVMGLVAPSDPDLMMTSVAITIGPMFGIHLWDHIIVGPRGEHYSIFDHRDELADRLRALQLRKVLGRLATKNPLAMPLSFL